MNVIIFALIIFFMALIVLEMIFYSLKVIRSPDREAVKKRLNSTIQLYYTDVIETDIRKKKLFSDVPFLNWIMPYIPGALRLDFMVNQAKIKHTMGFIVLCSIFLGLIGYLLTHIMARNLFLSILMALFSAYLPILYVWLKKNKRMSTFEKQFPEGLGLIARALRAGHAFTSAMKFASEEFEDPMGPEFEETLDEINFGLSVPEALRNLAKRVECPDLKFFVVSVILQRETGGNLAEIMENLAELMRERFKFRGKIKTLSAEGKMTAVVLISIPFLLGVLLYLTNREYIEILFIDPTGKAMLTFAVCMTIIGIFIMRKIINIDA